MESTQRTPPSGREVPRGGPGDAASCTVATSATDIATHHRIRREVFVVEQLVFRVDDADPTDELPTTLKVVGRLEGQPAGAVRLDPRTADASQWQGDRLAVLPAFRRRHVGAPLVDYAVRAAAHRGGAWMTAHVQLPNVRFFETLGWRRAGPVETYVDIPHQPMAIDLRIP
ncbi:MAG: hypothetical protein NVSMB16_04780 [Acidimicrobiales bacterium]